MIRLFCARISHDLSRRTDCSSNLATDGQPALNNAIFTDLTAETMESREKKFNQVFREHYDKMVSYLTLYTKDQELSKNIAQEAFLALWENMDRVDPEKLVSYVYAAARKIIINHVKRDVIIKRFLEHHRYTMDIFCMESVHKDGLSAIYMKEIRQIMSDSLNELKEPVRYTFLHSRYGLKSNAEIAQMQGVSEKLVEYRITVALKTIRKNLRTYLGMK